MSKNKYPFVIKTLEDRLEFERKLMNDFVRYHEENPEWADINISTCKYRMNELINGIELLKDLE